MQSYCVFCIYTTFYTIKAYIITIKNKLMNKIPYRYTTKLDLVYSIYTLNTMGAILGYVMLGFLALASGKAERSSR
jgi:hypothetical protein